MRDGATMVENFLAQAGWADAERISLRADFSSRHFIRLVKRENPSPRTAIFMQAGVDQKTPAFLLISKLLRANDISAPEIYAADGEQGLVLMEDFGDRNIGRLIDAGDDAKMHYQRAVDVLVHLHRIFDMQTAKNLDLPVFNAELFADQAVLFLEYYFSLVMKRKANAEEVESFRSLWRQALKPIDSFPQSLMLRDFMPDNLMDLPARRDWHSVGVLDFQDGGIGPMVYDLASLCEVVRRDAGAAQLDELIGYYYERRQPAYSREELKHAVHALSAQRHMRILGIVARAAINGKSDKLAYIPRIWKYLTMLLQLKELAPVREWMKRVPPPQGL